jgi:hypothetical protein
MDRNVRWLRPVAGLEACQERTQQSSPPNAGVSGFARVAHPQFARLVQLCEPGGRQERQSTVNVKVAEETIKPLTESLPVSVMV